MLYYHEIFASVQGESTDAGIPTIFIRLYGCNLKCAYCDQPQKPEDRKRISVDNLVNRVRKLRLEHVCITGGEPLIQPETYVLIYELMSIGKKVSVETNGCVPIDSDPYARSFKYIMDVKCPSSGVNRSNLLENLLNLHHRDEVKFVVADRRDYEYALNVLKKFPTKAKILFSPVFDRSMKQHIGQELCRWIVEDELKNARVQIQMHKVLGVL